MPFSNSYDILFSMWSSQIGRIHLNRPAALNSLTHEMCLGIKNYLVQAESDKAIKAIIITAEGDRAFCAGGDIRKIYENGLDHWQESQQFFYDEYNMNKTLFHFKKPVVSFLNGMTMGGGAGISIHGAFRVGTGKTIFAMPETGIGFFPDVGANYFLNKCPGQMGMYLALTGAQINAADALALGLLTHTVFFEDIEKIIEALKEMDLTENAFEAIDQLLKKHENAVATEELMQHHSSIERCFSRHTLTEIMAMLKKEKTVWAEKTMGILKLKSPTSLFVTYRAMQEALQMEFDEVMQMEFNIASTFAKTSDFIEGVRAAVIDKDRQPKWHPARLTDVRVDNVDTFFEFKREL